MENGQIHNRLNHLCSRLVISALLITSLTGARLPLLGARAYIVPAQANPPLGTDFKVKVGGTVLVSKFMEWDHVRLDGEVTVSIDKFTQKLGRDTDLRSFRSTTLSAKRTGLSALDYYCGPELQTQSALYHGLLGSVLGNVELFVRFCFADEDKDGRLDHVFLGGAKSPPLQLARTIDPISFRTLDMQPKAGVEMRITVKRLEARSNNVLLYVREYHDGKQAGYSGGFFTWKLIGDDRTARGEDDKINVAVKNGGPVILPEIIGYKLVIKSVDYAAGEVIFQYVEQADRLIFDYPGGSVYYTMIYI